MSKYDTIKTMKKFLFLLLIFISASSFGQVNNLDKVDTLVTTQERLFTPKDRDFLQLWYFDQVLKMQLTENERYDYLGLLTYYTYKMGRLSLPKYMNTDAEMKMRFDELVIRLNDEMKDYLSPENFAIHAESFYKIEALIYKKKDWGK